MDSSTVLVVLVGVIAFGSLVQAVFLIAAALYGRRLARRIDEMQERIDREISPSLENLSRISRNLTEVSDLAVLQARRVDDVLADTAQKLEDVTRLTHRLLTRPLGPISHFSAFFKGLRRGIDAYRQLGGVEQRRRGVPHRQREPYGEDEHMFI